MERSLPAIHPLSLGTKNAKNVLETVSMRENERNNESDLSAAKSMSMKVDYLKVV